MASKEIGKIVWTDLTIPEAPAVQAFYKAVTGWSASEFKMGDYSDYVIATPETGDTVAGICNARGENADLPPYWLIYVQVENLDASIAAAKGGGGKVLAGPKALGEARYCVLQDPAGAVFAIIEGDSGF